MRQNKVYLQCLPRAQAQQLWQEALVNIGYFTSVPVETIRSVQALGRVTGRPLYAKRSVPHYNAAAMDGIAVSSRDTYGVTETSPRKLKVLKTEEPFQTGGCYVVDTGDEMPAGTDAVMMIEDVFLDNGTAEILTSTSPWQHVRVIGEDIVKSEMVLSEHHLITPADIAALLAAGLNTIPVVRKPKVAIIPTGDEIVASDEELAPGKILDVNSHMLCAAVSQWGGDPTCYGIVRDDFAQLYTAVTQSLAENDMVIINAGTSAGREDFTARVLADVGQVLVHGAAIKPGKPIVLATCQGKPVIGLPGYPVSALLTAELFIRDILYTRQKRPIPAPQYIAATSSRQISSTLGSEEFIRVVVGEVRGKVVAAPLGRGAGMISSLTKAQGVIKINEEADGIPAKAEVKVRAFEGRQLHNMLLAVGSHDIALDILGVHLKRRTGGTLCCANVGSMGGIMAIGNNEAHIAGIHLLDAASGEYNLGFARKYLPQGDWKLVHLAMREQGLMLLPGNPQRIKVLADLVRDDVRYVNRQRGSGTRMLLDYQLQQLQINALDICGYEKEVATHMTVAATIAAGAADTGMGIRAAAAALALDFLPIANEQYDLLLNFAADDERMHVLLDILQSEAFRTEVTQLGGYDVTRAGTIWPSA